LTAKINFNQYAGFVNVFFSLSPTSFLIDRSIL
jgi:hypothetical protein